MYTIVEASIGTLSGKIFKNKKISSKMCLKHPIKNKEDSKLFTLTIEEYEKKYAEIEQGYIDGGEFPKDNLDGIGSGKGIFHLEPSCIFGYNTVLLHHLLTSERRIKFNKKIFEGKKKGDPWLSASGLLSSFMFIRAVFAMIMSGDHTKEDIQQTLRDFYKTGYELDTLFGTYLVITKWEDAEGFRENLLILHDGMEKIGTPEFFYIKNRSYISECEFED